MAKRGLIGAAAALVVAGAVAATLLLGSREPASASDSELIAQGKQIYQQYCASCHGKAGEGARDWEQPDARGELPPPPHDPEGHTWKHSDAMLYAMVSDGWRDPWNKTERLTMPAFGDILAPSEIRAVIAYLKTLWTEEQLEFQEKESEDAPFPPLENPQASRAPSRL